MVVVIQWVIFGDSGGSFEFVETRSTHKIDKTIEWNKETVKKEIRHFSDVLYVMHALFPKNSSNYKDSPFLIKDQKSCLQFKNGKSLYKPYTMYWRGADASIIGKNYVLDGGSASILKAPFPWEEKHLSWANGQIPEFFWQVYDKDDAITWGVYDEVMGEDGVAGSERIREEEITVYEKKLSSETSSMFPRFILRSNYRDYIKNLVKNGTDAAGKKWLTDNEYKLVEKELDRVANKVALATMKSLASFRDSARAMEIDELKKRAIGFNSNQIKWLATKYKKDNKVTDSIINLWNGWATDADAVLENLKGEGAKLGKKVDELNQSQWRKTSSGEIKRRR